MRHKKHGYVAGMMLKPWLHANQHQAMHNRHLRRLDDRPLFRHITAMLRALAIISILICSACDFNPSGLTIKEGWQAHSIAAWRGYQPDMIAFSNDGKWLYVSCENNASLLAPSLIGIHLKTGQQNILLFGLNRADGLKISPDGSLWIGEETKDGLIWRVTEPDKLPEEQHVNRFELQSSDPAIAPLLHVGRFSHEGFTFSKNGHFAYLADEWEHGSIYRYDMMQRKLYVLHQEKGWLLIREPEHARANAKQLHAQQFNRIEDMETLPNGKILLAETGTGRILILQDSKDLPTINTWLEHDNLIHPDNLAWDGTREWLWMTDDDKPSYLWAWDGQHLHEIAHHDQAEITGVIEHQGDIYFNLQRSPGRPEILMRISHKAVPTTP